jgi:glutamate synthase (NADPH/NADH) small chain
MATNVEKVFAAGDAASGASLVVNAIASGRRVAKKIDEFLISIDK